VHSLDTAIIPLPLIQPVVLGYQSGSLIGLTAQCNSNRQPLMRIGTLLAALTCPECPNGLQEDAVPEIGFIEASFSERRTP
jgi:hypothetical protein